MPWVESQGCYVRAERSRASDLPMAAPTFHGPTTRPPQALAVPSGPDNGTGRSRKVFLRRAVAGAPWWRRSLTSLGQWSGAIEVDLITAA